MTGLEPTAIGLAMAAVLLVTLILKGVVLPQLKEKRAAAMVNSNAHMNSNGELICQSADWGDRITRLESHSSDTDRRLDNFEGKVDELQKTSTGIASDVAVIKEGMMWMRANGQKRREDDD